MSARDLPCRLAQLLAAVDAAALQGDADLAGEAALMDRQLPPLGSLALPWEDYREDGTDPVVPLLDALGRRRHLGPVAGDGVLDPGGVAAGGVHSVAWPADLLRPVAPASLRSWHVAPPQSLGALS